jgi:hypothetical protein
MLRFPPLSDAYEAALFGANGPRPESAPQELSATTPYPDHPEEPAPALEDEDENGGKPPDLPGDMETARTVPLRRDRFHL